MAVTLRLMFTRSNFVVVVLDVVQEERSGVLIQELIAVKFELAEKSLQVRQLTRMAKPRTDGGNVNKLKSETKDSTPLRTGGSRSSESDGEDNRDEDGDDADGDLNSREMLYLAAEAGRDEIVKGILVPACTKRHTLSATFGHAVRVKACLTCLSAAT